MLVFVKRLAEESSYAFVGGFAVALQSSGDLGTAGLVGAATAGIRAVVGVLVKNFGEADKPSVK